MMPRLAPLHALYLLGAMACSNPTNDRAVTLDELDAIQAEDQREWKKNTATRGTLTAVELIELADCGNLSCVQLFMKDLSPEFFYAIKGEYTSQQRLIVVDTAQNELTIPASTLYVNVDPQADWRAAHTIHAKALADTLYDEFLRLDFQFVEDGYYFGIKSKQQRYVSKNYPGKSLYITASFNPWGFKGLYENNVTWPCYVFEVYNDDSD